MNKIYKVIWSHVKQCYVVTSELAKAHGRTSIGVGTSRLAVAALTAFVLTAGVTSAGLAADKDIVDKGAQPIAYDISPANDGTNIAIGKNAKVFIGGGTQESMLSFGEKVNEGSFSMDIHDNNHAKQNLPEAIAVGTNSYARTGSIEIGAHTLAENKISIGDTTADKLRQFGVASTTLGTNSYTGGGFATTIGSYNVQTSPYEAKDKWDTLGNATKNAFSTVIGTFNSNESMTGSRSSGVANIISGMANKVTNSNGAIVMGAGNSVKESSSYIDASPYSTHFDSAADMQKALMDGVASSAGGATLVIGGANSAEKTQNSQIMGVGNSMKSTTYKKVQYNYLDGFNSSITDASHVKVLGQGVTINKGADSNTVIGDYRTVAEDQTHNVIIGNADETAPITTEKKDTVILGHNANATIDGGVAIGAGSVAVIDKDQVGYDPANGDHHTDTTGTWKSKAAAVSVGQIVKNEQGQLDAEKTITRQITNVAAGTQDTDAVNVAQLKAVSDTVDASKTKYYSVRDIPFTSAQYAEYTNEKNDGAKEMGALAAGYMTYAGGIASTVTGSLSGVINQAAASGRQDFRGATALSYGTFNINNNTENSGAFSGVANSIVGQANVTTDSNAAMVYGAGNSVTNSYRAIDVQKAGAIMQGLKDPRQLNEALKAAVPTSGAQVMVMGGGNTVDKAYMTQVVGVGNTVTGSDKEYVEGTSTQLNYVDGFYNKVENGKNDYVIGSHNTLTGSNVDTNKSNLVLGDNHKLTDRTNNVILGSADKELTTSASDAVLIGHNADVKVDGGVALGSGSVASTDKDVEGYDPLKKGASESSDKAWKSSWAAVSVGDGTHTRQITGVAAGFADTDAVNVAQLKSVASLPVHIYSGGKVSSGSYTAGGPVANPTISSLQFDFGDGLKAEEVGAEGDKRVLVSLDKDALKGDPDFKGDKGEKGDTGAQGEQGPKGDKGDKGDTGATGAQGEQGPKGEKGDTGAQGEQGPKGDKGDKGDTGATGAQGEQGPKGEKGDTGAKGDKGEKGDTGAKGDKGDKGDTGAPGKDGKDGKDGGVGTVVGDDTNITVANTETDATKPANYKVSLNKAITVDKVTAGDTTISSNGVSIAGGPSMTKDGIDAGGSKITNVAAGTADTDAVNYGQLKGVESSVQNNTTNINRLNGRVNDLDSRINKVGAGAAALAALHPLDFNPDDKWNFAVGYGNYRNANSVALGAFYQPNENTMFNVATNFGNGENMINAGVSFKIGKGNSYAGVSKAQLVAENQQLKANDALQDQKIQKQDQEIQELKKALEELKSRIK